MKASLIEAYLKRQGSFTRGMARLSRRVRSAAPKLTYFHQTDAPHSHLMVQGLRRLLQRFPNIELECVVVPQPAADANPEPEAREAYAIRDARELAKLRGLRFSGQAPPSEDRLRRVNAVLLAERPSAEWLALAEALGEALWSENAEDVAALVRQHGTVSGSKLRPQLETNYAMLRDRGFYRGSSVELDGEWFWSVERLAFLAARLSEELPDQAGEAPRPLFSQAPSPSSLDASELEIFISFRSPYSYLALAHLSRVTMHRAPMVRPVLPMVTRGLPVPADKKRYIVRDAARIAKASNIPFGKIIDPLGEGVENCIAVCDATQRHFGSDAALRFAFIALRGIWSAGVPVASRSGIERIAKAAGVENVVEYALGSDSWKSRASDNRETLRESGLWGVPSFRIGEWTTWGQDRLELVYQRLANQGPPAG